MIKDFTSPFFEAILNTSAYEPFFFAKILLLIILFLVIVFSLNKSKMLGSLEDKPFVIYTISALISILAMRYLPDSDLIQGILLPYSALGIAITTFLPLMIFFFFIQNSNFGGFGRRAGWFLYGIIFLALWLSKEVTTSSTTNMIYSFSLLFIVLSIMFDKSIHKYFAFKEIRAIDRNLSDAQIVTLINKYHAAKEAYASSGHLSAKSQMLFLKKRLREEGVNNID